jgi:cytochrome c peroxidase
MQLNRVVRIFFLGSILLTSLSCTKEEGAITPIDTNTYVFNQPKHFPSPVYTFSNNTLSKERFELGKFLFYDPILSLDSTISCATCHAQSHGFADHNIPLSKGVNGTLGTRNAPGLSNLAWYPSFMWDGGVNHIEVFSVGPITNPLEMKETISSVVAKLNKSNFYREKFKKAYSMDSITDQKMLQALAQYMAMLVSADSKYDKYIKGEISLTSSELNGLALFKENCASCHTQPLFTDFSYRNNGIDSVFQDFGRAKITLLETDKGKFKVPSLRNVELTYPYMHDGRFGSLMEVLNHYSSGIRHSETLDEVFKKDIVLSTQDKKDLLKFLFTLTDYTFIGNKEIAEPIR